MRIEFHPEAAGELEEAINYLDDARIGAGARLLLRVEQAVQLIAARPQIGAPEGRVRRLVVRGQPYTVIYHPEPDLIRVLAVAHHRRRPRYWRGRLREIG